MHLADAFIQSNLQCIQAIHFFQYLFIYSVFNRRNKLIQIWNNLRVIKWQSFNFWTMPLKTKQKIGLLAWSGCSGLLVLNTGLNCVLVGDHSSQFRKNIYIYLNLFNICWGLTQKSHSQSLHFSIDYLFYLFYSNIVSMFLKFHLY